MKRMTIKSFVALLVLLAGLVSAAESRDDNADVEKAAIRSLILEIDGCLREKNLEKLSGLFASDADVMYVGLDGRERATGWENLLTLLKSQFETTKVLEIKTKDLNIFLDDPDRARYSRLVDLSFVSDGVLFAVSDIRETGVLQKKEGRWRVLQQHASAPVTDSIWPYYLGSVGKKPAEFDPGRKFTVNMLKEDFDLFRLALEEAHAGFYFYTGKEEFDGLFRILFSGIDGDMTEIEFYRYVCPVIEKIHCLHTWIRPSADYRKNMEKDGLFFPMQLEFISGKAFVVKSVDPEIQIPSGSLLVSVNGKPMAEILTALKTMFPSDGMNETYKNRLINRDFSEMFYLYIDQPGVFMIEYLPPGEETAARRTVTGVSFEKVERLQPTFEDLYKDAMKLEIIEELETAVLSIKTFVPRILERFDFDYTEFLRSSFQKIKEENIRNLIIDLRDNDGGEGLYGAELLSYLLSEPVRTTELIDTPRTRYSFLEYTDKGIFFNYFHPRLWERSDSGRYVLKGNWRRTVEPKSLRFEGKAFILINGISISATSGFAALAHYNKRAVFIGEETGGAYYSDNGGDYLLLTLPNTGMRVNIPLRSYTLYVPGYPHRDRGVMPDFEVIPQIEDILQGRDAVLDFALNLCKKSK